MGGSGPPKCKTCGKVEWGHLCGGLPKRVLREVGVTKGLPPVVVVAERPPANAPVPEHPETGRPSVLEQAAVLATIPVRAEPVILEQERSVNGAAAKVDRKEYLRLKARERRAAKALGLTVAEYRERGGQ